jgi:hypothetical protein
MPVIPGMRRLGQEKHKFEVSPEKLSKVISQKQNTSKKAVAWLK